MYRIDELKERHAKMLELQKQIKPFTPSVRELMKVWQLRSTNTVCYNLHRLYEMGLCVARESGKHTRYYAVERQA